MSWTCIAASSSTGRISRIICSRTSRRTSSISRSATAASIAWCTSRGGATSSRRCRNVGSSALVELLDHANGWWRDTAQRLLVERGDASVVPALKTRAAGARDGRAHAPARVVDARRPRCDRRRDGDGARWPTARRTCARRRCGWRSAGCARPVPEHPLRAAVMKLANDPAPAVRRQVALTLGELPDDGARGAGDGRSSTCSSAIATIPCSSTP